MPRTTIPSAVVPTAMTRRMRTPSLDSPSGPNLSRYGPSSKPARLIGVPGQCLSCPSSLVCCCLLQAGVCGSTDAGGGCASFTALRAAPPGVLERLRRRVTPHTQGRQSCLALQRHTTLRHEKPLSSPPLADATQLHNDVKIDPLEHRNEN